MCSSHSVLLPSKEYFVTMYLRVKEEDGGESAIWKITNKKSASSLSRLVAITGHRKEGNIRVA